MFRTQCSYEELDYQILNEILHHSKPTLDDLQVNIVDNNLRPQFKNKDDDSPWSADEKFKNLCETIKDCWDCDAEARLTAGCVLKRVQEIQTQFCTNVIIY